MFPTAHSLTNSQVSRYSRHLILPAIGIHGQEKLLQSRVLVVGCGGLGCPVLQYLTAAGVGTLGIVDYDVLEMSNLQRQTIHTEENVGKLKTESATQFIYRLNSDTRVEVHNLLLDSSNSLEIVRKYDVVVDCTDNLATRYLLNDCAVICGKPLVSAGALKLDGQITTYNYQGGPCLRCIMPVPPPAASVGNCNAAGVLGVIVGIMGCLQALEVIKIIVGMEPTYHKHFTIFDGVQGKFSRFTLRGRQKDCEVCGDDPSIKEPIDYVQFCGSSANDAVKYIEVCKNRITVQDYEQFKFKPHLLLDVRPELAYNICCLPGAVNIPLKQLPSNIEKIRDLAHDKDVFVVCKHGNDSQRAAEILLQNGIHCKDIIGGVFRYSKEINPNFPTY